MRGVDGVELPTVVDDWQVKANAHRDPGGVPTDWRWKGSTSFALLPEDGEGVSPRSPRSVSGDPSHVAREPVRKGGGYSYKNEGKKDRQETSLADLKAEIAKKRRPSWRV